MLTFSLTNPYTTGKSGQMENNYIDGDGTPGGWAFADPRRKTIHTKMTPRERTRANGRRMAKFLLKAVLSETMGQKRCLTGVQTNRITGENGR